MEKGLLGTAQRLYIKRNDIDINFRSAPISANLGTMSVGDGAWDGLSTGKYSGSANGTILAANAISGFLGNLLDLQNAGSSKFKIDSSGNLTMAGSTFTSGAIITPRSLNWQPKFSTLGSDVSMTSANTYVDAISITLSGLTASSGTIALAGITVLSGATAGNITAEIVITGGNSQATGEMTGVVSSDTQMILVSNDAIPLAGTVTFKLHAACTVTGSVIKAATADNSPGNFATWLMVWQYT